ncbi:pectate lyase C [Alteromonas pelagimontana]|uniref:Pectate lyase C n=1 Tax=Alteromonas pelagimontana TaxID=1858656 RepID=A0A6M4MC49_9ALTE|nr:pectate lyase C [Alteromonas pelagimontana]QJR80761.1 pectate lyase C [Alteromonas pelagimontana]
MKILHYLVIWFGIAICVFPLNASAQELAFDGALGFGKYTVGGNQGRILIVDTLADNASDPQPGSLRWAVKQPYPRLIVFAVSGVITLEKELEIKHGNLTLAGHTSEQGIVISGATTSVEADQVIIRHLRFRPGHFQTEGDAVTVRNTRNVIIDHCSLSWANDEVGSFYNNQQFTLQNSILSESLNNAGHHKGDHGYGGIWGGNQASFLRNILVSHTSRNPRLNGWRLKPPYSQEQEFIDIRNNLIANWKSNSMYGGENGKANIIGNVFIPGPATRNVWFYQLWAEDAPHTRVYLKDNLMYQHEAMSADNLLGVVVKHQKRKSDQWQQALNSHIASHPLHTSENAAPNDKTLPTSEVWTLLLDAKDVGANLSRQGIQHDSVDSRILQSISSHSYTGKDGIVDSEKEVVQWDKYRHEFAPTAPSNDRPMADEAWRKLALEQ